MVEKRLPENPKSNDSLIINLRLSRSSLTRLYLYLDKLEETGCTANPEFVMSKALHEFLEAKGY
jgi:hypothetical protein